MNPAVLKGEGVHPSRDEFAALARGWTIVPVWCELLADLTTPVAAYARLVRGEPGFVLESVEHAGTWGRWSFIGRRPSATMTLRQGRVSVEGSVAVNVPEDQGILAAMEAVLSHYRAPSLPGLPPLHGGIVGYLGYDVIREVERLHHAPPDELGYPDAIVSVVGQVAAYDAWRQRVTLVDAVPVPARATTEEIYDLYDLAVARLQDFAAEGAKPIDEPVIEPPERDDELPPFTRRTSPQLYSAAVEAAREYIFAGDIFQVVLAQRFELDLEAEPLDLYRSLRQVNPSPYMYLLQYPELAVVGSRPSRWCVCATDGSYPDQSPAPADAGAPTWTTGAWPPSCPSTRRNAPNTSCWSTWPATTWAKLSTSARRQWTS